MKKEYLCPMLSSNEVGPYRCAGEACAWWDSGLSTCCIYSHFISAKIASDSLDEINAKIPDSKTATTDSRARESCRKRRTLFILEEDIM